MSSIRSLRPLIVCLLSFVAGIMFCSIQHGFKVATSENPRTNVFTSGVPTSSRSEGKETETPKSSGPRKILLDCGANVASTVKLFRQTYPEGKDYIIHSFEIDERLEPFFSSFSNHYLHCPVGVAEKDGQMTAFSESAWSPTKGKNNNRDMQWGGGSLYVNTHEKADNTTGGKRKLSYRNKIPVVDISKWIKENTKKEDYVIFKLDVEGAEFLILQKMLKDGTFEWIDKFYGEYHRNQPVGLPKEKISKIIGDVKKVKKMYDWSAETRKYADFDAMHPVKVPSTAVGKEGMVYTNCTKENHLSIAIFIGMSKAEALKVMSTLESYSIKIPVTVFVYSDFAEEWPYLVKMWAAKYEIGLRGNHPYPYGHFEMMPSNWIREAIVSSEMRLHEIDIIPVFYSPFESSETINVQLKKRQFRIIQPAVNFPPKSEPKLTVENYYRYRDVERVPKALRVISDKLMAVKGGILGLDTDLPDTHMNLVFLLDYLVENSGYKLVTMKNCLNN